MTKEALQLLSNETMETNTTKPLILLTGGTGYVGGRLLPLLEQSEYPLRCLVRHPDYLKGTVQPSTEVAKGDVLDPSSLRNALTGVHTAFYLVHSMSSAGQFEEEDRIGAQNFAQAAKQAGVQRIIYLGGLGDCDDQLSAHLRSRHEVGELLKESHCQVIEMRASIIIGSGSLSFELVRSLVERLPVMICPKWVQTVTQPIGIEDLLAYLMAALRWKKQQSQIFEIGGPQTATYGELMQEYASQRGLRRWLISVPVLTPRLSSLWLGLITPVYARIGRKLIESMRNPTLIRNHTALDEFDVKPRPMSAAIARAIINEDHEISETRWSDAFSSAAPRPAWGGAVFGNRIIDSREVQVEVPPEKAFAPVRRIGGTEGWYFGNFLWTLRGWIDLLIGGIGQRRGRRDPQQLRTGDVLDWWRVEKYQPDHLLRLTAEMKVPGRAWLEFEVNPTSSGSTIRQTAIFDPLGLSGWLYWYTLYPLHAIIFRRMLRRIGHLAEIEHAYSLNTPSEANIPAASSPSSTNCAAFSNPTQRKVPLVCSNETL